MQDETLAELNAQYGTMNKIQPVNNLCASEQLDTNANSKDDAILIELAQLSEMDYLRQRKEAAKKIGINASALDKLIKQKRTEANSQGNDIFPAIKPWHEPIELALLLDQLIQTLNRFLVFPTHHEAKAIALWIVHTHCLDAFHVSPILLINSPEKRCGKTTLLTVLQKLVNRPLTASNITAAALFRSIEKWQPTLLIDEADTFMRDNEELRGVINSGHSRDSAYIIRCTGDNHEPLRFFTWCPKVIAGIGRLADTIEDRSVTIQLRRKLPNEKREQFRDVSPSLFDDLLKKCVRFAEDTIEQLRTVRPYIPEILNDRAADNWKPLLAIAELANITWSKNATEAALYLSTSTQETMGINIELLQDIKTIFDQKKIDRLSTADLLEALCADSEAPWVTYNRGKPLAARQLANKLKEFHIFSSTIRISLTTTKKGYSLDDFQDAFKRYLADSTLVTSVTTSQPNIHAGSSLFSQTSQDEVLHIKNQLEVAPGINCDVVTDRSATGKIPNNSERVEFTV